MTNRSSNSDSELESLVFQYMDGQIYERDLEQLNERLRTDDEARQVFAELLDLDSAMAACAEQWVAEGEIEESPVSHQNPKSRVKNLRTALFHKPMPWLAAAAVIALLLAVGWWKWEAGETYATVATRVGIEELSIGAALRGELHEIKAGTVEFSTRRGARVVIEAPARFRFESAQSLRMFQGRMSAAVPPAAKGFTVITPTGEAVDLGTKFGVDVPADGAAEVHVFQGEVITKPSDGGKRLNLRHGEAVALQAGADSARELRSAAFIRPEEMAALSAGMASGQQSRSEIALEKLRRDPALIALLDFEKDEALSGRYRMVQGRWPGSHAAEFVHVGDRMKVDVGGDRAWPQLSLVAWVRIDLLGEPYQSLYHTDGWNEDKSGQVHWMINRDTTMRLALRQNTLAAGSTESRGYPDSLTPVLPERGRWMHLAVVYDATGRTVRFYLNGKFDKETRLELAYPARLGPAQIGNWDSHDRKLSGRVDELILLGRTLIDDEVLALYAAGNPYR